jgi:hypothetical protein
MGSWVRIPPGSPKYPNKIAGLCCPGQNEGMENSIGGAPGAQNRLVPSPPGGWRDENGHPIPAI